MKLIVGLGNPGAKYKNTRHNLGFMVVDGFAKSEGLAWRYNQDLLCYYFKSSDFILIKPSTYMNKSGESVRLVSNFYKIEPKDILAVHDDLIWNLAKLDLYLIVLVQGTRELRVLLKVWEVMNSEGFVLA